MKLLIFTLFLFQYSFSFDVSTYVSSTYTTYSDSLITFVLQIEDSDIDDDGDIDLYILNKNGYLIWLENLGDFNFKSHKISEIYSYNPSEIIKTDYNSDSFDDIILYAASIKQLLIYENDGLGNFKKIILDSTLTDIAGLSKGDFNNDQKDDILLTYENSNKIVALINRDSTFFYNLIDSTSSDKFSCAAPCDINNDGYDDIYFSSLQNGRCIYYNSPSGLFTKKTINNRYSFFYKSYKGDVNNDGYEDLILGSGEYFYYMMNDKNDSLIVKQNGQQASGNNFENFSCGDINNDGLLDVVGVYKESAGTRDTQFYFALYTNYGNDGFIGIGIPTGHYSDYAKICSLNNDSNMNIITGNRELSFHTLTNNYYLRDDDVNTEVAENSTAHIRLVHLFALEDTVTYIIDKSVKHGSFEIEDNYLHYTPNENFVGRDTLRFHTVQETYDSRVFSVFLNVVPFNDSLSNTDYHIITTKEYESSVQEFIEFRKEYTHDLIETPTYSLVEDIYKQHGDSTSILAHYYEFIENDVIEYDTTYSKFTVLNRRFAIYDYINLINQRSPTLKYIFFVGNIDSNSTKQFIPSGPIEDHKPLGDYWYSGYSGTTDENPTSKVSFGRITPDSVVEVENYFKKVQKYEQDVNNGIDWKNNVTLLIDDDTNGLGNGTELLHHFGNSKVYIEDNLPEYLRINKINMDEYPKEIINNSVNIIGDEIDFANALNKGSFITVTSGHGFRTGFSMEQVFTTNDIKNVDDNGKPSFMLLGGCLMGDYSNIIRNLAEALTLAKNGGAIAAIGATYETNSYTNFTLYREIIKQIYNTTNRSKTTFGELDLSARSRKRSYIYSDNFPYYGDPGVTYKPNIVINNQFTPIDTLSGGDTISVSNMDFFSDNINSSFISINDTSHVVSFNSYDTIYSYNKEGDSIYFDFSTGYEYVLDTLKNSKGKLRMMFFGEENDYIYYKDSLTLKKWDPKDTFTKTLNENYQISMNFGANPIPSNTPLKLRYCFPEELLNKDISLSIFSMYGKRSFTLKDSSGVIVFDNIKEFLRGSVGKIVVVVDGEVAKWQDIYCE